MTPRTAAGRALLEVLLAQDRLHFADLPVEWEPAILAIEAEAARQERERIQAAVEGIATVAEWFQRLSAILDAAAEGEGRGAAETRNSPADTFRAGGPKPLVRGPQP